jgi:hypothetical protein
VWAKDSSLFGSGVEHGLGVVGGADGPELEDRDVALLEGRNYSSMRRSNVRVWVVWAAC